MQYFFSPVTFEMTGILNMLQRISSSDLGPGVVETRIVTPQGAVKLSALRMRIWLESGVRLLASTARGLGELKRVASRPKVRNLEDLCAVCLRNSSF